MEFRCVLVVPHHDWRERSYPAVPYDYRARDCGIYTRPVVASTACTLSRVKGTCMVTGVAGKSTHPCRLVILAVVNKLLRQCVVDIKIACLN